MDFKDYMLKPGEKPLDRIVDDGGFTGIFRKIACVGDSLSSGEMQVLNEDGTNGYHDMFEYSWGQYIARMCGSTVYNFSRGGMTASEYMNGWAQDNGCWDPEKKAQAYIIALGVNDVSRVLAHVYEFGSVYDVTEKPENNPKTVCGYYGALLYRYMEMQPEAKFFLMTMPVQPGMAKDRAELYDRHREFIYALAKRFKNVYVLDFRTYAPVYDEDCRRCFWLNGHLNPAGYLLTAKMTASYIDYIIRSEPEAFGEVALIGTGIRNYKK